MLLRITASIYVDAPEGSDPQVVASRFGEGLETAVSDFPGASVELAEVEGVELVPPALAEEKGLEAL